MSNLALKAKILHAVITLDRYRLIF